MSQSKAVVTYSPSCPLSQLTRSIPESKRRTASLPHMPKPLPPPPPPRPPAPVTRTTPSPTSRPAFHLAVDASDQEEDPRPTDSSDPDFAPTPSTTERETSRRYHALSELLSTELGYLLDLRTFVSVRSSPAAILTKFTHPPPRFIFGCFLF